MSSAPPEKLKGFKTSHHISAGINAQVSCLFSPCFNWCLLPAPVKRSHFLFQCVNRPHNKIMYKSNRVFFIERHFIQLFHHSVPTHFTSAVIKSAYLFQFFYFKQFCLQTGEEHCSAPLVLMYISREHLQITY